MSESILFIKRRSLGVISERADGGLLSLLARLPLLGSQGCQTLRLNNHPRENENDMHYKLRKEGLLHLSNEGLCSSTEWAIDSEVDKKNTS